LNEKYLNPQAYIRPVESHRTQPSLENPPALNVPVKPRSASPGTFLLGRRILLGLGWGFMAFLAVAPLRAMVFYATADPNFNTTPPTGRLAGSGWQWVGTWGGFQGTVVGRHAFLAARHVGGAVGESFVLNGVSYLATGSFDDPQSDLRVWIVQGTFPSWAPLYRGDREVGLPLVVFGRGMVRGAEVRDPDLNLLRGWQWSPGDGRLRWGENRIAAVVDGGSYWGALLRATFDEAGGPNEAHLALGDSSGPVFVQDGADWKLAGVATTVDSAFNTTEAGPGFSAAIFDIRGLYFGTAGKWRLVSSPRPVPSGFYATRVSVRASWIETVLDQDEQPKK